MAKIATNQERLNQLFDMDPRNDTGIGIELGVSKQTISAWRNGSRSPKKSMIVKIASRYNVSEEWLMGWDLPGPVTHDGLILSPEERILLDAFRSADDRAKNDALQMLQSHKK